MEKKKDSLKYKIQKIDKVLVEYFGIPPCKKKLANSVDLIIATILSQNTNDVNSYKAYEKLKKSYDNWNKLLKARKSSIQKKIRVAGLAQQKSTAIVEFVKKLYDEKGKISLKYIKKMKDSDAIEELTKFNGIGVKTASCVLLFAEGRNVCPVDTHVHRTLNRIGIINTTVPDKTFLQINKNFPSNIAHQFHTNLIRLGREICKAKNPICGSCPLIKVCDFEEKDITKKVMGGKKDFMLLDAV